MSGDGSVHASTHPDTKEFYKEDLRLVRAYLNERMTELNELRTALVDYRTALLLGTCHCNGAHQPIDDPNPAAHPEHCWYRLCFVHAKHAPLLQEGAGKAAPATYPTASGKSRTAEEYIADLLSDIARRKAIRARSAAWLAHYRYGTAAPTPGEHGDDDWALDVLLDVDAETYADDHPDMDGEGTCEHGHQGCYQCVLQIERLKMALRKEHNLFLIAKDELRRYRAAHEHHKNHPDAREGS